MAGLRKYKSLYSSTTNSFGTGEGVTITPNSVSGLPTSTSIVLTFDRVDSTGTATPSKMERIKGTISGGNFVIASSGRGFDGTTEQAHTSPVVEMIWNATDWNDAIDALTNVVSATTGAVDTTKVVDLTTSQTLTNKILTSPTASNPTFTGTNTEPKIQGASSGTQFPQVIGAFDNGNSGTSKTIDWSKGDRQFLTLTGNVTIDFSNASAGQTLTLVMLQDGTGGRTIAWTPTITWQDGITWGTSYYTTTIAKYTIVVIQYINSAYLGNVSKFA